MDGITLAKICDVECQKRGISKAQFYKDIGVSAPSFHGWKNGAKPSDKYISPPPPPREKPSEINANR